MEMVFPLDVHCNCSQSLQAAMFWRRSWQFRLASGGQGNGAQIFLIAQVMH
jgi:hypothetical protein